MSGRNPQPRHNSERHPRPFYIPRTAQNYSGTRQATADEIREAAKRGT